MDKCTTPSVSGMLADVNRYCLLLALLAGVAILSFLIPGAYFVMAPRAFLSLHLLLEFSSVLLAFMVFGVTWHSLSSTRLANTTLLGCAMLATGTLDFVHTLSYSGISDSVVPSFSDKGMAFWLAARFTIATALCVASFMSPSALCKPRFRYALLFGFSLYTPLLLCWLVFFYQSVLAHIYVEGYDLPQFKTVCEWGIIGLLVIAVSRFWRPGCHAKTFNLEICLFTAAMIFIMSEIFFTQYKTTGDVFNVLGHLYKIIGYVVLYLAVFVTTIQAPFQDIGQQEMRYRQLFENMISCGVVYQAVDNGNDFVFLEVNNAAERTEKITREDFIGRRVTELFPGVVDFGLLDVFRRVWRTGQSEHFPVRFYQDARIAGWRENYVYRLASGNVVAVYDDITKRKLAEQALQESEKNFRTIFETAAIGMGEADPITGVILRVNMKLCRMTGYSEKELLAKTFSMITHPDDRERDMDGWLRMARGEIPEYVTEKRYIHKDGHEIWVQLNVVALRNENGMIVRTVAAIADITARKQAEADRRRYNQELQAIFNALPDFYFRLGPDGTILSYQASPLVMGDLYVPPKQFLGRRMVDVLPQEPGELFAAKLKEQRSSGKIITFEYQLKVASGERYYEARLASLGDSGDVIVLVRDIVERQKLEQQLLQAQKMEVLGQLTGGIAHDFNNILAAILGYSNLALERCVTDPSDKLARYLGEVISASERARDLIAKMLAYSRTSSVSVSAPLDMIPEVEKAVAMLSAAIPAGIEVITHIEPYIPLVRINPIDLQQVLINLAVNARDAIGEQGRIDITLERAKISYQACAICHKFIDGDYVVLEVKDSGCGIPADIEQRIFDPFFTTKEVGKGSGLGLSMVQGTIIKNNAHLLMETGMGQGTSFRLLFPVTNSNPNLETGAVASVPPLSMPITPEIKRWRVWVVEDQAFLAAYYLELLQDQGYLVTIFTDPTEALRAFRLDPDNVDLVLTDQAMPHLNGTELAGVVLEIRPELPVILLTGYNDRVDAEKAKSLGIRCYLNKPVDGTKLLDILAAELSKNSLS